jgi:hypothetical protein
VPGNGAAARRVRFGDDGSDDGDNEDGGGGSDEDGGEGSAARLGKQLVQLTMLRRKPKGGAAVSSLLASCSMRSHASARERESTITPPLPFPRSLSAARRRAATGSQGCYDR